MAFPQVDHTSSGHYDLASRANEYDITLPAGISIGDKLICFVSCLGRHNMMAEAESSVNWYGGTGILGGYDGINVTTTAFYAVALALGLDALRVGIYNYANWVDKEEATIAWICYCISGAASTGSSLILSGTKCAGATANWDLDRCPELDDGVAKDYLWLLAAGAETDHVATGAPTNYTNLLTTGGIGVSDVSISSCRRELNQSQLDPGTFTAPLSDWMGINLRVTPRIDAAGGVEIYWPWRKVNG